VNRTESARGEVDAFDGKAAGGEDFQVQGVARVRGVGPAGEAVHAAAAFVGGVAGVDGGGVESLVVSGAGVAGGLQEGVGEGFGAADRVGEGDRAGDAVAFAGTQQGELGGGGAHVVGGRVVAVAAAAGQDGVEFGVMDLGGADAVVGEEAVVDGLGQGVAEDEGAVEGTGRPWRRRARRRGGG
jgi:hypothetical protein